MLEDIGRFRSAEVVGSFQLAEPFHPFAQLMAVLPAASAHALPSPCQALMTSAQSPMTSAQSPIADFYPTKIEIDMDGVSHNLEWAGVVKLPFVDENRLLAVRTPTGPVVDGRALQRKNWLNSPVCCAVTGHQAAGEPADGRGGPP
jgi:5'-3' exonuclease